MNESLAKEFLHYWSLNPKLKFKLKFEGYWGYLPYKYDFYDLILEQRKRNANKIYAYTRQGKIVIQYYEFFEVLRETGR